MNNERTSECCEIQEVHSELLKIISEKMPPKKAYVKAAHTFLNNS